MDAQHTDVGTSLTPGGPPTGERRLRSLLGAALIVIVSVGGVAAAMFFARSQDARPIEQAAPTTTVTVPSVEPPATSPTTTVPGNGSYPGYPLGEGGDAAARYGYGGYGGPGKPLPPLDLPTVDYTWLTATLPVEGDAWVVGVVPFQGRFIALVSGAEPSATLWESTDGAAWTRVTTRGDDPVGGGVERILAGTDRLYVLGHLWQETGTGSTPSQAVVWTSTDGVVWSRSDLGFTLRPYESVWFSAAAAGPSGAVMFGTRDYYPPAPPVRIEKGGKILELSGEDYTYKVLDAASGAVLVSGSQDEMWNNNEDGQVVTDPVTGETLVVIPWDVWSAAYEQAYRFEGVGVGDTIPAQVGVTIDYDGIRLILDEKNYRFRAEDAASGALLAEGSLDDLYRGPGPRFTDPAGTVIFSISWQELDKAYEDSSRAVEYSSTPVILVTRDGTTWESVPVDEAVWGTGQPGISTLVAGPAGYLAAGNVWPNDGPGVLESEPAVGPDPVPVQTWRSADGRTWEKAGTFPTGGWVGEMVNTATGYLAVGGTDAGAPVLWMSSDGRTWSRALDRESLGLDENLWFEHVLVSDGGVFLTGTREGPTVQPTNEPATISKDGRTLTMGLDGGYTVTDDATGAVLFDQAPTYDEGEARATETGIVYTSDGLLAVDESGTVVFKATNAELEDAWTAVQPEWYQPEPFILFSADGATWQQVTRAQGDQVPTWYSGVAAGNGALVVYGSLDQMVEMANDGAIDATTGYIPPLQVVLVGRPV